MTEKPQPRFTPSRALVVNLMLSLLAASAVFVVVSYLVLVPQMARQEAELRALRAEVTELRQAIDEAGSADDAASPRPAQQGAQPAAPKPPPEGEPKAVPASATAK